MALHDVVIRFVVEGTRPTERAFQSVEQAARRAQAATGKASMPRPTNAPTAQTDRDAARSSAAALAEEYRRSEGRAGSMSRRPNRVPYARSRAQADFEGPPSPPPTHRQADFVGPPEPSAQQRKAADRDADKEAKAKVMAMIKADRDIARIKERAERDTEKRAQQAERRAEQTAKAESRAAERATREKSKLREKENNEIVRDAKRIEREEARALKRLEREMKRDAKKQESDRERFGRGLGQGVVDTAGRIGQGVMGGMQRTMGLATQLGGGFSVTDSVTKEQGARKKAAELSAQSAMAGNEIGTEEILTRAKSVGIAQNLDTSQVLEAFDLIKQKTGDLGLAMKAMPDVARIASATGTDVGNMSRLAGELVGARPDMKPEELSAQLRVLSKQGIVGGVELPEMAKYGARLTAGASQFGGDADKNVATLGAMAQMSKQYGGAASAAEAAMGSQRFSTDIAKHADVLKAQGIDVADGKGTLKDAQSIILEMLRKTGGDVTKLSGLGLGERGIKPVAGAAAIYRKAGGGEAGERAVKAEFRKYTGGVSKKEIEAANRKILAEQEMEIEMRKLSIEVGQTLLPVLRELAPAIKDVAPVLANVVRQAVPPFVELLKSVGDFATAHRGIIEGIAAHPIGAIMAKEVVSSIGTAGIGAAVKSILVKLLGGGGTPTPGGGGGPSPVTAGVVGGVAAGAVVVNSELQYSKGTDKAEDLRAKVEAWQRGDFSRGMSPEAAQKEIDAAKTRLSKKGVLEHTADLITSPFVDASSRDYSQYKSDQALVDNKDLAKALQDFKDNGALIKAMDDFTKAAKDLAAAKPSAPEAPIGPPRPPAAASGGIVQRTQ